MKPMFNSQTKQHSSATLLSNKSNKEFQDSKVNQATHYFSDSSSSKPRPINQTSTLIKHKSATIEQIKTLITQKDDIEVRLFAAGCTVFVCSLVKLVDSYSEDEDFPLSSSAIVVMALCTFTILFLKGIMRYVPDIYTNDFSYQKAEKYVVQSTQINELTQNTIAFPLIQGGVYVVMQYCNLPPPDASFSLEARIAHLVVSTIQPKMVVLSCAGLLIGYPIYMFKKLSQSALVHQNFEKNLKEALEYHCLPTCKAKKLHDVLSVTSDSEYVKITIDSKSYEKMPQFKERGLPSKFIMNILVNYLIKSTQNAQIIYENEDILIRLKAGDVLTQPILLEGLIEKYKETSKQNKILRKISWFLKLEITKIQMDDQTLSLHLPFEKINDPFIQEMTELKLIKLDDSQLMIENLTSVNNFLKQKLSKHLTSSLTLSKKHDENYLEEKQFDSQMIEYTTTPLLIRTEKKIKTRKAAVVVGQHLNEQINSVSNTPLICEFGAHGTYNSSTISVENPLTEIRKISGENIYVRTKDDDFPDHLTRAFRTELELLKASHRLGNGGFIITLKPKEVLNGAPVYAKLKTIGFDEELVATQAYKKVISNGTNAYLLIFDKSDIHSRFAYTNKKFMIPELKI